MRESPEPRVLKWAASQLGWPPDEVESERLKGSYSWRTYRLRWARIAVILRVAPSGWAMAPYDAGREAATLTAVGKSVPVPTVIAYDQSGAMAGRSCILLQNTAGSRVLPEHEVPDTDRARYRRVFGKTLAALHLEADPSALDPAPTITDALRRAINLTVTDYQKAALRRHPGFEVGLRWLLTHMPEVAAPPVLCHGDYRLTNLLWKGPGVLSAVVDWERAWVGDPMVDVAFSRLTGGWCSISGEAQLAYEVGMGAALHVPRVNYALRFERWRRYIASMQALRAHVEERSDDPRLERIGLAGDAGAWTMVDLLSQGPLVPLPRIHLQAQSHRALSGPRTEEACAAAVEALRAHQHTVPGLAAAIAGSDPALAYIQAHDLLTEAAATGGPELIPALEALKTYATATLNAFEESQMQ